MVKKTKNLKYYESVGRRKQSVARVRLHIGSAGAENNYKKGDIVINDLPLISYFPLVQDQNIIMQSLALTNNSDRFIITIKVNGGGKVGQLDAISLGIARALCLTDETLKVTLRHNDLLTRDSRKKERRMVGTGGKSRRRKQSPKR